MIAEGGIESTKHCFVWLQTQVVYLALETNWLNFRIPDLVMRKISSTYLPYQSGCEHETK